MRLLRAQARPIKGFRKTTDSLAIKGILRQYAHIAKRRAYQSDLTAQNRDIYIVPNNCMPNGLGRNILAAFDFNATGAFQDGHYLFQNNASFSHRWRGPRPEFLEGPHTYLTSRRLHVIHHSGTFYINVDSPSLYPFVSDPNFTTTADWDNAEEFVPLGISAVALVLDFDPQVSPLRTVELDFEPLAERLTQSFTKRNGQALSGWTLASQLALVDRLNLDPLNFLLRGTPLQDDIEIKARVKGLSRIADPSGNKATASGKVYFKYSPDPNGHQPEIVQLALLLSPQSASGNTPYVPAWYDSEVPEQLLATLNMIASALSTNGIIPSA